MAAGGQLGHYIGAFADDTAASAALTGQTAAYGLIYYNTTSSEIRTMGNDWVPVLTPVWTRSSGILQPTTLTDKITVGNTGGPATAWMYVEDVTDDSTSYGLVTILDKDGVSAKSDWYGIVARASHTGAAAGGTYYCFDADVELNAADTRTLTAAYGLRTSVDISATDTITTYYGVNVTAATGSGSITNAYGLYIGDLNGITNNFSIYQAASNMYNYFAGPVGIGINNSTTRMACIDVADSYNFGIGLEVIFTKSGTAQATWKGIISDIQYTGAENSTALTCFTASTTIDTVAGQTFSLIEGFKTAFEFAAGETFTDVILFHGTFSEIDGDVENYYGVKIEDPSPVTDINNSYGIHIANMSGTTGSYGVYQASSTDKNYFAGQTGIGTSTFAGQKARVHVTDANNLNTGLEVSFTKDGTVSGTTYDGIVSSFNYTGAENATSFYMFLAEPTFNTSGTQTLTNLTCYRTFMTTASTAVLTNIIAFHAAVDELDGDIENYYGLKVDSTAPVDDINNSYGVHIGTMGGTTGSFGIYQSSSADKNYFAGKVGIGTANPATSALLDLTSTTGALLIPRMTTTQRDNLTALEGMIIYNDTTKEFHFFENGSWVTK